MIISAACSLFLRISAWGRYGSAAKSRSISKSSWRRWQISKGTRVVHELLGEHMDWNGAQLDFLWPQIVSDEIAPSGKNDDSLVFRVRYCERSFLFPGDAEKAAGRAILSENDPQMLQADILKIGHHGSKNSTMPEFLDAVRPRLAVISQGKRIPTAILVRFFWKGRSKPEFACYALTTTAPLWEKYRSVLLRGVPANHGHA
jgi:beta-lactamase superfamily II metal-dependent hydrolase